MIKNILAVIGAIVVILLIVVSIKFGGMVSKVAGLDEGALPAYMKMFGEVLQNGDPAKAMMIEYKVNADVSNDAVAESVSALTEEYNMRLTGDIKMYTNNDAAPAEVKHARIFSLCNLTTAKVFLNYSRFYGGFMPCRIMLVEYGNGDRFLVTMNMDLAIYGGTTLPPEMFKMASMVQEAMINVPKRAAKGDF